MSELPTSTVTVLFTDIEYTRSRLQGRLDDTLARIADHTRSLPLETIIHQGLGGDAVRVLAQL